MKINNNNSEIIEQLKRQHMREIENLRFEHTQNFNELKSIYENVKNFMPNLNFQKYILRKKFSSKKN